MIFYFIQIIKLFSKTPDVRKMMNLIHKMLRVCVLCPLRGSSVDLPVATAYGGLCVVATFCFSVLRLHNLELVQGLHEDGLHNPKCNTPSRMRSAIRSRPSLVTRGVLLPALLLPIERRYAAYACVRPCLRATCWCRESSRVHSSSHECSRINIIRCTAGGPCLSRRCW